MPPLPDLDTTHLDRLATVEMIATFELVTCSVRDRVERVWAREDTASLDFVPATDGDRVVGVLALARGKDGSVRENMLPLTADLFVSRTDPLVPVLERLHVGPPFRLVLDRPGWPGILTLSDLQKLPAHAVLFSQIVHLEVVLSDLIRAKAPDHTTWLAALSPSRRSDIEERWELQRRARSELTPLDLAYLIDRFVAVRKLRLLPDLDPKYIDQWARNINELRHELAHPRKGHAPNTTRALHTLETLRHIRELIEATKAVLAPPSTPTANPLGTRRAQGGEAVPGMHRRATVRIGGASGSY